MALELKDFKKAVEDLLKRAKQTIINTMIEQNVACISFANNGNSSEFDVDKAYCTIEDSVTFDYVSREILAVYTDGNELYVLTEDWVTLEQLNKLEETTIFTRDNFKQEDWLGEDGYDIFSDIDGTLDVSGSIVDLTTTIDEVLNGILKGEKITDNLTLD